MPNLKISAPSQILVGFDMRSDYYYDHNGEHHANGQYQLGFATFMDGKILRKEKSWNQWRNESIPIQEHDNVLIEGFKLKSVGQRSRDWFGTGRHVWQIVDPRGFILEITSENMYALMEECDIIKGEIKAKCLWAWSGANMSLIPETSELYQNVLDNNKRIATAADKGQLQIGNKVTLKDGTSGIYYGKYHAIMRQYDEIKSSAIEIIKLEQKKGKSYEAGTIWYATSEAKVSTIDSNDTIEPEVAFSELSNIVKKIRSKGRKAFGWNELTAEENLRTISNYTIYHLDIKPFKLMDFYVEQDLTDEDYKKIVNLTFTREHPAGSYSNDFWKQAEFISCLRHGDNFYQVYRHEGCQKDLKNTHNDNPGQISFQGQTFKTKTDKHLKWKHDYGSYSSNPYLFKQTIQNFNDKPMYSSSHCDYLSENEFMSRMKNANFKKMHFEIEGDTLYI